MAVKYLDGNRIRGTAAERAALATGAVDTVGSSANGTNDGASTGQTGKIGSYAWNFGGNDGNNSGEHDHVDADGLAGDTTAGASIRSISVWAKQNNNNNTHNDGWIMSWGDKNSPLLSDHHWVIKDAWGRLEINLRHGGVVQWEGVSSSSTFFLDHAWHHIVVTMGTEVKLYLDGTNIPSSGWGNTTDLTAWIDSDMDKFTVGSSAGHYVPNYNNAKTFDGSIDQILMYNDELTQGEITTLWASGSGTANPLQDGLIAHYNFEQTSSTLENVAVAIPPNLPAGTIFEQTNDYKYYIWDGTSTWTVMVAN